MASLEIWVCLLSKEMLVFDANRWLRYVRLGLEYLL